MEGEDQTKSTKSFEKVAIYNDSLYVCTYVQ